MLSATEFERTRRLALQLAGIELRERHREWLVRRWGRQGGPDAGVREQILAGAENGESTARRQFIGLVTTRFTRFLRHPDQLDTAARHVMACVANRGMARIWSAAAATGEEPYSMAWALTRAAGTTAVPVEILATDIDEPSLEIARQAEYPDSAVRTLPEEVVRELVQPSRRPGFHVVRPEFRRRVTFQTLNLTDLEWPLGASVDVILCRNILMYLESGHRYSVLERLASCLAPDGLLFLDPSEHPGRAGVLFESRGSGRWTRRIAAGGRVSPSFTASC